MCSSILSSLQTAVLAGIKIDSPDKTDTNTMEHIIQLLTQFTEDPNNHTPAVIEDFKKLEEYCHCLRLKLKTSCGAAKKQLHAEERRGTAKHKKDQKNSLLKLNKLLLKPKAPYHPAKTNIQMLKWACVGLKQNSKAAAVARRKVERVAKKQQKEAEAAERKRANAGQPKNSAYIKFQRWFKPARGEAQEAGFEHKRDYNKYVWSTGLETQHGLCYDVWDDFKKSPEAPWADF